MKPTGIREPVFAGTFYPGDPQVLQDEIERMLSRTSIAPPGGALVALIVPHAGYPYSGLTASTAYKLLERSTYDAIVIVGPSHREYFEGISVFSGSTFRTPLGDVPIDGALRSALTEGDRIVGSSTTGHLREHSIEVQVPFLQTVLPGTSILPIVMGSQDREYCLHLGRRLGETLAGRNVLLIATTDLSHYHSYDDAGVLDDIIIRDMAQFDVEQMMGDLESNRTEACGGGPAVAVLDAARRLGADKVRILYHCNSGDVTGHRDAVVGYLSAAALRPH